MQRNSGNGFSIFHIYDKFSEKEISKTKRVEK